MTYLAQRIMSSLGVAIQAGSVFGISDSESHLRLEEAVEKFVTTGCLDTLTQSYLELYDVVGVDRYVGYLNALFSANCRAILKITEPTGEREKSQTFTS